MISLREFLGPIIPFALIAGLVGTFSKIQQPHRFEARQQSAHPVPDPTGSSIVSPQFWQTSNLPTNWKSERYRTSRYVSSRQV